MAKRKSSSPLENLMDTIIELTDMIWQVGAVASIIFIFAGVNTLKWAIEKNNIADQSTIEAGVNGAFGLLFYTFPIILLGIAFALAVRTFNSYCKNNKG